jgi:hypothetical protein
MGHSIIRVSDRDHIFLPEIWMLLIVMPQNMNQCHVDLFFLPIYLWMKHSRSLELGVHVFPKCSPKGIEKYGILI